MTDNGIARRKLRRARKVQQPTSYHNHLYSGYRALPWSNADFREVKKTNSATINMLFGCSKRRYLKQTIQRVS